MLDDLPGCAFLSIQLGNHGTDQPTLPRLKSDDLLGGGGAHPLIVVAEASPWESH